MDVSYSKSIYYNVRLTSRYIKAFIAQILEDFGLEISSDELFTLDILKCEGSMCQRDLAKLLFKDRANTGKIAQSLEKKGLITISVDQKIKRLVKKLSITKKGKDLLSELTKKSRTLTNKISEKFSEKEYENLITILHKIVNEIKPVLKTQI
ncbi:MarR family transcriptional regulator [bacterium]|nr:MarR family transcriptional regulator [bacterium]